MDNLSLYRELERLLRMDSRWCTEDGVLMRNAVVEAALAVDPGLVGLLMGHDGLRRNFFTEVGGVMVFDKVRFQRFVSSKSFLPNSYTAYKNTTVELAIDDGSSVAAGREVVLAWPHKDCLLEGGQTREEARRQETFWSEVLAPDDINRLTEPKVLTAWQRHDSSGAHAVDAISPNDNLIIKGNNLLALHSLKRIYGGRVKLIYIDPPFNTGNDSFGYNDSFKHSTWLTFMRNRLMVAKELLAETGNIFIHIDINESHYLKVLCDEVFWRDNFVEEIIWAYGSPSGGRAATPKPVNIHDYILHYAKEYKLRKQNKVYVPYTDKYINDWFKYVDEDGRRYQRRMRGRDADGEPIWVKQYLDESKGVPLSTVWTDIQQVYADPRAYKDGVKADVEVIKEFKGGQKPEALLARIIEMATDEGDLVLDFHLGTGTTVAVAHKMKRQYIGVEQMESQIEIIKRRLANVINGDSAGVSKKYGWQGGGSFVYCELASLNQRFADEILAAGDHGRLHGIWAKMQQTGFLSWNVKLDEINANAKGFDELCVDDAKRFLIECLDKNLLYVPLSEIGNAEHGITDEDKRLNNQFYSSRR